MSDASIFGFPVAVRGFRYPGLRTNLSDLAAALDLFQDLHDLRFGETTFAHGGSLLHRKYAGELQLSAGLNRGLLTRWCVSLVYSVSVLHG